MMTDNEIIKALECCTTNGASCKDCPAFVKVDRSNCKKYFRGALDLINRLQAEKSNLEIELKAMRGAANSYKAENERLKAEVKFSDYLEYETTNQIKAEAYKEFAERLIYEMFGIPQHHFTFEQVTYIIDKLLKEMVGE